MKTKITQKTKRGDTIIEVMFALAIFGLVAILSINAMNGGLNNAETALEFTTSRSEIDAQTEVLRYMHSSYNTGGQVLWDALTSHAISTTTLNNLGIANLSEYLLTPDSDGNVGCDKVYVKGADNKNVLARLHAFAINTRKFDLAAAGSDAYYLNAASQPDKFVPANLSARITYNDDDRLSDLNLAGYSNIDKVEGLWGFVVKSDTNNAGKPYYYDFYLDACWYGPGAKTPTILDTVMRLYNPEAM